MFTLFGPIGKKRFDLSDQVILLYSAPLLVTAAREFTIKEPTVKAHILEKHVEFLDRQKYAYPCKGLGFWSEQGFESVHYDRDNTWTDNMY